MINKLIAFCNSHYKRTGKCAECSNACQGGCEKCLDAIHFSRIDRSYNCDNIAAFYACKYSYKYSSEIDILLSKLKSLQSYDSINAISIGCGPCTELMGLHRYIERANLKKPLTYIGFDLNQIWQPIHLFYSQYFSENNAVKLRFSYSDACKSIPKLNLSQVDWRPNILFLQYVLSDMVKSSVDVKAFIDSLMSNIIPKMPLYSYVIINDINHIKARQWFDYFENQFCSKYTTWKYKGHFKNNIGKGYPYGFQHSTNNLTCQIPSEIDNKYNPWAFCSSAHLVLKKRSE